MKMKFKFIARVVLCAVAVQVLSACAARGEKSRPDHGVSQRGPRGKVLVQEKCSESEVDGVYRHLAMQNDEGECGTGAVVPWAGSLWVMTYGPHCPVGSSDKLYRITPDLKQTVFEGSVGGTPADRMIHRESNQLLIGPYVIDAQGNVRTVPVAKMPGRLTGAARHLTDPAHKVYVATMETGLYELDLRTLAATTLIRENGKNDGEIAAYLKELNAPWPDGWNAAPKTTVPGYHGKGLASGFGRVFVANNGEDSLEARANPFVPSGVLADWSRPGDDWRMIRRCQFTEITTADGIYGNEHPETNPIWSLGWDAKSVLLAVTTNGTAWTYYRLPKASHCYDGAHGWNTEWPRIREAGLGGGDLLATMHGTFWRFPKGFSPASPNGIRPISTYLKVIGDFCYWKDAPGGGSIVFGCDDHAKNEFLGKRKLKADQPKIERSTSNLWFVKPEELAKFGPPAGEGWVWYGEDVRAGDVSDPYLWEGYARRTFTFTDAEGRPVAHELVHEGDWVRVRARADAKGARAHFVYAPSAAEVPPLDTRQSYIDITDDNGHVFRFPNVNGDTKALCREVATERDLLYVGGVFYELPAENAGGFAALRPIALADEPVRSIAVDGGLIVVNGKRMVLDSLWKNSTAPQAYELWRRHFRWAASATVDFNGMPQPIRRALWCSGWGGQLTGPESGSYREIAALGLTAARTHDWALGNPGQRMCDLHFMFPLLHADTEDPKNYFFGPTDEILRMTIENLGMNVMFRMGTSIESVNARRKDETNPAQYYNSVEPLDWEQFTKAHAQIIRHYTEGKWNGFKWGEKMQYWELWNEPNDNPGGSWIIRTLDKDRGKNNYTFNSFYIYVLKRLKAEFPHLKFGGPALCSYDVGFLREMLRRCKEADYTPDFISWHSYGDDPTRMLSQPAQARKLLDEFGFTKTEIVINEWHWFPDSWWGKSTQAQRLDPETGVASVNAAVYALQVMTGVQETCLDQSYYYGCSHRYGNLWGYRNVDGSLNKHYWAMKLLADLYADCDTFQPTGDVTSSAPVRVFGAKSRDGKKAYLLVTAYRANAQKLEVTAKGLDGYAVKEVRATDQARSYETLPASFVTRAGDTFEFWKPDASSAAAYLVVFEKK